MNTEKIKCVWCDKDFPNEKMTESRFLGGQVCPSCDADEGAKTLGDIHDRLDRNGIGATIQPTTSSEKIKCDITGCTSGDLIITLSGTSICRSCLERAMPFIRDYFKASLCHGEVQANKREKERAVAWQSGGGWVK